MGVVGAWPHGLLITDRHLHRKSRRRKKRGAGGAGGGGKVGRSPRWCGPDIAFRLSPEIRQLLLGLRREDVCHSEPVSLVSRDNMPGGFENSSLKTSFSLSSLQPSSPCLESPEHAPLHGRPYSSLRKKPRNDPPAERESWRRSWGRESSKDEFWAALENNYQYLMDNNLIDSCQEARRDLLYGASPTHEWSYEQFVTQFTELDSWLNSLQDAIYSKSDSVIDRKLRLTHMEELQRKTYKRKLFNNQGGRLVARSAELREEVVWRIRHLNSKWERLEAAATPQRKRNFSADPTSVSPDVEHELRCLQKWLKSTEERLPPHSFTLQLPSHEIDERMKEYEVIARDVWAHGRIVRSVVKLCERLTSAEEADSADSEIGEGEDIGGGVTSTTVASEQEASVSPLSSRKSKPSSAFKAAQFAKRLERRWQNLYISCLERTVHLEEQKKSPYQPQTRGVPLDCAESDEEPLSKHRRLTDSPSSSQLLKDGGEGCLMEVVEEVDSSIQRQPQLPEEQPQQLSQMEVEHSPPVSFVQTNIVQHANNNNHETSKFTSSSWTGKNCATLYVRHKDTDTEGGGEEESSGGGGGGGAESSEEEWTFRQGSLLEEATSASSPVTASSTLHVERLDQQIIQRLVEKAEEIVASPVRKRSNFKCPRVKEWLQHQYPEKQAVKDSCDASSEYTTEDDELEAKIEEVTDSIQELDTTLVGSVCDSELTATFSPEQQSKVILRAKKRDGSGQQRPWSVSGGSTAALPDRSPLSDLLSHSISESAIHQLDPAQSSTHGGKMESSVHTGSTLSSSTVEDTTQTQEGSGGYSSNSLRRRKLKHRKRTMNRRSESGSEGPVLGGSDSQGLTGSLRGSPTKTGSTAPSQPPPLRCDRASELLHRRQPPHTVESPDSSGGSSSGEDSDDSSVKLKQKPLQLPAFRLGPSHVLSSYGGAKEKLPPPAVPSNDSSFSEQAWDNYQEKYMSEAYSEELVDSETAKRLLEFGDDYRNFLDSQSDCASSLGRRPVARRPRSKLHQGVESDNNLDEVWHLVQKSSKHLHFSEQIYNNLAKSSPQLVMASDFGELISNCRENVKCLRVLLEKIEEDTALLSELDCKEIRSLMERWDGLGKSSEDLQTSRSLRREIYSRKEEVAEISDRAARLDTQLNDWDQLDLRIQEIRRETCRLKEVKGKVHSVNVAVHRFLTDSGLQDQSLKEEVAQLYGLWEDTFHRLSSEEARLEETRLRWSEFDTSLAGLEGALRSDSETLRLLDQALSSEGGLSPSLASSARDLAKLLNEHHTLPTATLLQTTTNSVTTTLTTTPVTTPTTTGVDEMTTGSLSDSGISDSGSEQELSERERRLAALRRLARHLEAVLAPGSAAIVSMAKRIEATEAELRGLQQTCRELIIRTAVSAEAKSGGPLPPLSSRNRLHSSRSPKDDKGKEEGWLWRVMRTALPFQLALMALFCFACLLEPQCCDSAGSLTLSIHPQLRYLRGPPPV